MRDLKSYTRIYHEDYAFESWLVHYRRQILLDRLRKLKPRRIVEIGCGAELLVGAYLEQGGDWDSWVIVEPAKEFAEIARSVKIEGVSVLEKTFEESVEVLTKFMPDMIICAALLHELVSPERLLSETRSMMVSSTILHLNVPNSESLHRRLAKSMGLIETLEDLSKRNIALQQPRVFNVSSLTQMIESAGLCVTSSGGYFVKPFTHAQMEKIVNILGRDILDGLQELGISMPDLASEIYVEAKIKS